MSSNYYTHVFEFENLSHIISDFIRSLVKLSSIITNVIFIFPNWILIVCWFKFKIYTAHIVKKKYNILEKINFFWHPSVALPTTQCLFFFFNLIHLISLLYTSQLFKRRLQYFPLPLQLKKLVFSPHLVKSLKNLFRT